jgi:hypothetical protein
MKKRFKKLRERSGRITRKLPGRKHEDIIPDKAVPRITNETIAEHREEVLAGARKYIYPLQHSKHRIVLVSTAIFIVLLIGFASYCTLSLYKFKSSSTFMYRVTQVVPFPIAHSKAGFVSYESYLFELRHYVHYYETQQKTNFDDPTNQGQLETYRKQALDKVVNDAYVKELASKNSVSVTNQEVDAAIATVRNENRLGTSDKVFEDVLREFWGWSINDFRRALRQQLLAQKVVNRLDTDAHSKAEAALAELNGGANFADIAKKYSDDDVTKNSGGDFGAPIDKNNKELSATTTTALYNLKAGQVSDILDIGYALEIVKNTGTEGDKAKGAHIIIKFKDINEFIKPLQDEQKATRFINV